MAFLDDIRLSVDNGLGIIARKGLSPYQCYLTKIVNDQISFNDVETNAVRTDTRITVSTGYEAWIEPDGYMNPGVSQLSEEQLFLSAGALSSNEIWLGPLVMPYHTSFGVSGGTDPNLFQPVIGSNNNVQIYIWIKGFGLNSANGNYFAVKKIASGPMHGLGFYLVLTAIQAPVV
jgi:hypothetical protein